MHRQGGGAGVLTGQLTENKETGSDEPVRSTEALGATVQVSAGESQGVWDGGGSALSSNCRMLGVSSKATRPKLDNWGWAASWHHTLDSGQSCGCLNKNSCLKM